MRDLEREINRLKFHQKLLLNVIRNPNAELDVIFFEKNLSETEAHEILRLCDKLSKQYEIEKAEGYIHFQPLFNRLTMELTAKVTVKELIEACLKQGLYDSFMKDMVKIAKN
ncbi:DUF1878 family protein [Peribacillus loiseleuriae]|uniref:DUF1878 domain-containing protein n=1 Tax=Peribacillus loiseleuriae TaxID=1679170 RepID=A0A0K9GR05_9BACI|nr:DUF1878 family protein [Peribacillus loiseleuriae]KMY49016.1 hypothetical protein AC625_05420 [Peribacillus loiseleuriae]